LLIYFSLPFHQFKKETIKRCHVKYENELTLFKTYALITLNCLYIRLINESIFTLKMNKFPLNNIDNHKTVLIKLIVFKFKLWLTLAIYVSFDVNSLSDGRHGL